MKIRKTLALVLCICILGSFACAFAANDQPPQNISGATPKGEKGAQMPRMDGDPFMFDFALASWNRLLDDGVIDEDTLKAVEEYFANISENDGEMPEPPEGAEMPQMPEDGKMPEMPQGKEMPQMPENGEMPEPPEGFDGERPEMPEGEEMKGYPGITLEFLDELLENEVIDEDIYNAVSELIDVNEAEAK